MEGVQNIDLLWDLMLKLNCKAWIVVTTKNAVMITNGSEFFI